MDELQMVETCWRIAAARDVVVTCAIYRDHRPGFVIHAGLNPAALVDTARANDIAAARTVAERWRTVWLQRGFLEV